MRQFNHKERIDHKITYDRSPLYLFVTFAFFVVALSLSRVCAIPRTPRLCGEEKDNLTAENARDTEFLFSNSPLRDLSALGGEPSDPGLFSALFMHPDLPEESLVVQGFHHAGVDEPIGVGFFRLGVLA